MASAVSKTEKIRDWVRQILKPFYIISYKKLIYIQTEHVIGIEALAEKLDTKLKAEGSNDYYGLTDKEAAERLK